LQLITKKPLLFKLGVDLHGLLQIRLKGRVFIKLPIYKDQTKIY